MEKAKAISVAISFLLIPVLGWTQQNTSDSEAWQAFQKADSLRHAAHLDSSTVHYQKAARLFEEANAWENLAAAMYKLSFNATQQGDLDRATRYLEKGISNYQKHSLQDRRVQINFYYQKGIIAEARAEYEKALKWHQKGMKLAEASDKFVDQQIRLTTSIGEVELAKGQYDTALQQLREAEELYHQNRLKNPQLLSRIYNSRGILHKNQGEWKNAHNYFQQSLEIDRKTLPSPHPQLAKGNNNLATIYYYQSDYQRALDHMKNAVSVLAEFYGEDHRQVAAGYNNLGVVYSMTGELEKAADYLQKALEIKTVVLGKDHPEVGIGYMNLGAIYYDMQQYDRAITNYNTAREITLKHFPEGHPELADIYANLGQTYAKKGAYEKALDYYHKDLNINLELLDANHPFIGDTYTKIGETYAMTENYAQALKYYQQALGIVVSDFSEVGGLQNPSLDEVVYPDLLLQTLELKADALHNYYEQTGDHKLLDQSLQTYLQAVQLIEKLQHSFNREKSKFLLRGQTVSIYKKGAATAYQLYQKTNKTDYKEYAFYFAEKSRAQILLDQIRQLNAQELAGVPNPLIAREHNLRSRLTDLQQQLSQLADAPQQSDSLKRIAIQDSMFHLQTKLEDHIQQLESAYPKYHQLKYAPVTTSAAEIQEKFISPGQTVFSYFFGTEDLFAFVITKKSFEIRKLPADSLLRSDVRSYRQSIQKTSSVTNFESSSHRLYNRLVKPLSDLIVGKELLIIPDGVLHYLPFESLVSNLDNGKSPRFRNLSYLINNYNVSYAPSAGYLELNDLHMAPKKQKQLIGFAPVFSSVATEQKRDIYSDFQRPISALPLSKKEVKKLGALYNEPEGFWSFLKSKKEEADIFIENNATEFTFKNAPLENYRYIHLATHAFIMEEQPGRSGILFAAPENQKEDGTLYASEIYNLQLNAELVALSACNTGVGSLAQGEGMMSLSRAFQYAGAKNLLVSLWSVDDRSTARLMIDFYEVNQQQNNMPAALREAKMQMIETSQYAHPKYWAPFIFIGQ